MSGFDSNTISSANLNLQVNDANNAASNATNPLQQYSSNHVIAKESFIRFIRTYSGSDHSYKKIYLDQLLANYKQNSFYLNIDMSMYIYIYTFMYMCFQIHIHSFCIFVSLYLFIPLEFNKN